MLEKRQQSLLCYLLHISRDLDIIRMPVFTSKHCTGLNHAGICCLSDYMYITSGHVFIFSVLLFVLLFTPPFLRNPELVIFTHLQKKGGGELRLWNSDYRRLHTLRMARYIYAFRIISCSAFPTSRQMPFKSRSSRFKGWRMMQEVQLEERRGMQIILKHN